jgi:integrase
MVEGGAIPFEDWLESLKLAPKTRGNIRNVLQLVFKYAVRRKFIDIGENPVALVRVKGISRRQTEPRVLTSEEIQALIAEISSEPARTAVIMAIGTGLRCSELFALKWLDVNWEDLSLKVERAIVDGVVGDVKTKYSRSRLPLDASLAEVLFTWRRASQFVNDSDWIFASPQKAGEVPLRQTSILEKHLRPAAQRAQLDGVGWHTFRHTYSSMLRQLGVDVKVQQELLRHADIRTTLNVYSQAPSDQKRAANSKAVHMALPGAAKTGLFGRVRENS